MKIHDVTQRSPEWFAVRNGVFSASEFGPFITGSGKVADAARLKMILRKIRDTQEKDAWETQMEANEERAMSYNVPVQRGNALEAEAREYYQSMTGYIVQEVGFVTNDAGDFGCSPDGLIPAANAPWSHGLEIKCPMPVTHLEWLLAGELPEKHKWQVHGSMAVTGLSQWDFMSYCPGQAPLLIEVRRDRFTDDLLQGLCSMMAEKKEIKSKLKELWEKAFKPEGEA